MNAENMVCYFGRADVGGKGDGFPVFPCALLLLSVFLRLRWSSSSHTCRATCSSTCTCNNRGSSKQLLPRRLCLFVTTHGLSPVVFAVCESAPTLGAVPTKPP